MQWINFSRRQWQTSPLVRAVIAVVVVAATFIWSNAGYATVCAFVGSESAPMRIETVTVGGVNVQDLSPWSGRLAAVSATNAGTQCTSTGGSPYSTVSFAPTVSADGGATDASR